MASISISSPGGASSFSPPTSPSFTKVCSLLGHAYVWLALFVLGTATPAHSQTLDGFQPGPNGTVYAMAPQPDGKSIAVGSFTALGGQPRNFIGRINTDGTVDPSFNPQVEGYYANCVAVQPDGKILVGGWFWGLCGQPRGGVGRLNADGSLDTTFANPAADWPVVNSLVVQADGKIVIGGKFSSLGGQRHFYLARLNSDGTQDSSFTPQPDNEVWCLALQPDGKILVGGLFNYLGGQLNVRIGRLNDDGTVDAQFQPSSDSNIYWVACLGLQADGKILVGGYLSSLAGAGRSNMGRLNADGSIDASFSAGSSGWVYSLVPQADGKILVGGAGSPPRLWRLTEAGAVDTSFTADADNEVFSITLQPDGKVLVSGDFANLGGGPCSFLGRLINTDAATQHLTAEDTSIIWLRGGTSPEAWRTSFEASTNGTDWVSLGAGTRVTGGWQLTGVAVPTNGTVRARAFVEGGYQNGLSWMTEASTGPLLLYSQPQDRTNNAATPASFSVAAAGTPPLSYQWRKDGTNLDDGGNIIGANQPTLVLGNVFAADRGGYSVVVGNGSMSLTSRVATLTVMDPLITIQPTSQVTNAGQAVTFGISAAGTPPLGYQWFKNEVSLSDDGNVVGSQTQTLTLTNVSGADRGDYWVTVTNSYGSVTSLVVSLTVADPFITTQPASQVITPGETVNFSVLAGGSSPLSYQWRKYGVAIPGETTSTLSLTNVQWSDTGSYNVVVTNVFGSVNSSAALLAFPAVPDALNPGVSSSVYCLAAQPDGKTLVGGSFTSIGGQARINIGRLNADGTLDPSFNPGAPGSTVYCLMVQPDGKVMVGGGFNSLGGQIRTNLGRLNADGTLDRSFTPSVNGLVYTLGLQPDGKVVVGGNYSRLGGQACTNIGRLNADGTLDTSFNAGANGVVNAVVVQADTRILVGGAFSALGGQSRNYLGRLKADGTLEDNFNPGPNSAVYSLALQADGRIVVGGGFVELAGQTRSHLGRLMSDGTLDASFNPGANGGVFSVAAQANGQILVAGAMTALGKTYRNYIGRVNPDGSVDPTFNPGADAPVNAVAVQPDGKLLVGGSFSSIGGQARSHIARLTSTELASQNLAFDSSRIIWSRGGASPEISRASFEASTNGFDWLNLGDATYQPGEWQLAGLSIPANSVVRARGYVAGGYQDGSTWFLETSAGPPAISIPPSSRTNLAWTLASFTALGAGSPPISYQWLKDGVNLTDGGNLSGVNTSTLMLSNVLGGDMGGYSVIISNLSGAITSSVVVLGVVEPVITVQPVSLLTNAGQTAVFSVAAVGTLPFGYQWRKNGVPLPGGTGSSLALTNVQWADGGIYDVLVSNTYGTNTSSGATLGFPATLDSINPAPTGPVYAVAVQTDGKILVGGSFLGIGGKTFNNIGRLLPNGALDTGFNPAAGDAVNSLAVQADGRVLLGGIFPTLGGQIRPYLGRVNVNGTLDASFNPSPNAIVNAVVVQPDGKIVVGGGFTNLCGQPRSFIGRLNVDGTLDTNFTASAGGAVYSLAIYPDGKIAVGGAFTNLCGQARARLGRLNADGTLDAAFASPLANNNVYGLLIQPDGKLLVGGAFTSLYGQNHLYLGRVNSDGALDESFNPTANNIVYSLALQADGKVLVGGSFTSLNGQTRRYIGRLNSDGTLDNVLSSTANGVVYALGLQPDGSILAGGNFSTFGGQPRSRLARLGNNYPATQTFTFDGTNITWLRNGASPEVCRTAFEASTDGSSWISLGSGVRVPGGWRLLTDSLPINATVYAAGPVSAGYNCSSSWFVEASAGPPAIHIQPASLTNNSSTPATLTVMAAGTGPLHYQWFKDGASLGDGGNISGATSPSLTLSGVLHADAAQYWVVITNAFGNATSLIASLTVVDPYLIRQPASRTNNAGTTATFSVQATGSPLLNYQWFKDGFALEDNANLSGTHTSALTLTTVLGSDAGSYLVVVSNAIGTATSTVASLSVRDPYISSSPASQTVGPGQSADFNVAAAGTKLLYQWRKDRVPIPGAMAPTLVITNAQRLDAGLYDVVVSSSLDTVLSAPAMLTVNLATVDSLNPGPDSTVNGVAVQADGKILVGGSFTLLGAQPRSNLGRLDADGSVDGSFAPDAVGNDGVYCFASQPDGDILVGGGFLTLGGQSQHFYGRLSNDGTLDPTFSLGARGWVSCFLPQADGKIFMSGGFDTIGAQSRNFLAKLNADGSLDTNFNPGANYSVLQLASQADGKILACGAFSVLGGQTRNFIGRLNADGSLDTNFNPGANGTVFCLAVQPDGRIVVGGSFTTLGGQVRTSIGRLNDDGTLDSTFNPGANGFVDALALQTDGRILVSGQFTMLGGHPRARLGRLNSDGSLDNTFDPGADNSVKTLALQVDGNIVAGGDFTVLGGQTRAHVGRLQNTDPASQTLAFEGSNLNWLRAGTGPEVWRTSFEACGDGTNWFTLGLGTRIPGGWQVTNVSLAANFTVRARGFVAGAGYYNNSSSFVESQAQLRPAIIAVDYSSDLFGASVRALPGQTVVVEATRDLMQWSAIQTNLVPSDGIIIFTDSESGLLPSRYYRARLP